MYSFLRVICSTLLVAVNGYIPFPSLGMTRGWAT